MFVALGMAKAPPERRAALIAGVLATAGALPGVRSAWAAPVLDRAVINAGDIVWRVAFEDEAHAAALARALASLLAGLAVTSLGYRLENAGGRAGGPGIWRALVFRCFPGTEPARKAALAAATLLLPGAVPEIRRWALSPVQWTAGETPFEFVWEQEFDALDGLTGPYMDAPAHWGLVDAFFDADCPEYIVDPRLVQVIGSIAGSVMG
ncbi:MAG: Dabb family protein [Sphingomonadales bacterium]|nr:Dabb family protein [Sphingomonadales bacterium]